MRISKAWCCPRCTFRCWQMGMPSRKVRASPAACSLILTLNPYLLDGGILKFYIGSFLPLSLSLSLSLSHILACSTRYHLYFPLKLPEPLPDNDDDNDKSSAATTALPHPPEVAAAPERANPEQLRECSGRKPHVATCDSRGRAHYGWHVDLGKHFGDRGLGGSRTLASNDYSAAVVSVK